ncbi:MAG: hypothetical protein LBJ65_14130 [Burkholderia sp.]|uniref:hypothetical protein n=1 Tax=Burkholderia sp. TaxID=36773 RepID=UPI00281C8E08|nr:hypothetical protein [Burkholderia sp.]MDR0242734.1 hypothetical protein [Burkholderia sp.]
MNRDGHTPLERALRTCGNADLEHMVALADVPLGTGTSLPAADLSDVDAVVQDVRRQAGEPAQLCRLAVAWVRLNPDPLALVAPSYRR